MARMVFFFNCVEVSQVSQDCSPVSQNDKFVARTLSKMIFFHPKKNCMIYFNAYIDSI